MMGSIVWSVSCWLFFCSRCPSCPAIYKSGEQTSSAPRAPWSRRHWINHLTHNLPISSRLWTQYCWLHNFMPRVEYLLPTYNIEMFLLHSNSMKKSSLSTVFNKSYW